MNNYERAIAIYELFGQAGVEALVRAGLLNSDVSYNAIRDGARFYKVRYWVDCWTWCSACESLKPIEDSSCLACGSKVPV